MGKRTDRSIAGVALCALVLTAVLHEGCDSTSPPESGDALLFPERPDVLLVVVDALRRDHVGAYGYPRPTTPFLDHLASTGVVFDHAWAQAPHTFISTATLLTARYFPYLTPNTRFEPVPGLREDLQRRHSLAPSLAAANLTLPEILQAAGYETAGFFTNPHHHRTSGFWQGFDAAEYLLPPSRATAYARAPKVHHAFFRWLDQRTSEEPYFAYLHFMDPHAPYRPLRRLRRLFETLPGREPSATDALPAGKSVSADDVIHMKDLYDAEIRLVDGVLEELATDLRARGRWDRTLIVVTADHGDEFMDHGGLGHGATMEKEQLRIPLIWAAPAAPGIRPGRRPEVVRNLDVAPTILELAGLARPPELDGTSLVPLLTGGELSAHPGTSFAWLKSLRSFTDRDWHFIWDLESGDQILYDNHRDPAGRDNLAARRPDVAGRLAREISRLEKRRAESLRFTAQHPEASPEADVDAAIVEQLEALGYL